MGTDVTTVQEELVVQLLGGLLRDDQGKVNGEEKVHFQSIQLLDGNTADARVELVVEETVVVELGCFHNTTHHVGEQAIRHKHNAVYTVRIQYEVVGQQEVDVGQGAHETLVTALEVFGNPIELTARTGKTPLHVLLNGNGRNLESMEVGRCRVALFLFHERIRLAFPHRWHTRSST